MSSVYADPGKSINNFGLGGKGRHRSNVWKYPGFNSFGRCRDTGLAMHPTVKPVAMVADALMDCSNRGGIVLDPFGGSGTTMIAAGGANYQLTTFSFTALTGGTFNFSLPPFPALWSAQPSRFHHRTWCTGCFATSPDGRRVGFNASGIKTALGRSFCFRRPFRGLCSA